ncbi:hypothetical protein HPB52_008362 [Rhipicephalus sanguineus]|uniref:Uncharacterized protein n=1 Tax=Rhipicephalus sanguineus TaxID=34632 RepID=A0A9D4T8V9_RHISA|nr:hypothetical protein HPB52_008362 [Rhipicephalus sanguineus]
MSGQRRRSDERSSLGAPWGGFLRKCAACLAGNCSRLCPLLYHQIISSHRRVNHGKLSSADVCFLLAELSLWNVLLQVISFELREILVVGVADNMKSRHSFVLVHWLVMEHICIEFDRLGQ